MSTLELCRIRKAYDNFVAVDHLSFAIAPGQIYGLLGPNGAGKTSTIRMMGRKHLARIGYLPEERGLYKKMKLLDHLVLLAELKGVSATDAAKKATFWCERLNLSAWMEKKIEELSKGMQQKAQFIGALLHEPEFIIMDEPFSGLDPANAVALKDVLVELKQAGKTILFSTHRMDQVERLCDSICLINHGQAVLEGELKEVKSRYGRRSVQLQYEGSDGFLNDPALVLSANNYGNFVEVKLQSGADSQDLLKLVASRARVTRFELMEPSLEEIFIEEVGKAKERAHA